MTLTTIFFLIKYVTLHQLFKLFFINFNFVQLPCKILTLLFVFSLFLKCFLFCFSEFGAHLGKKKCPQCKSTFDTETKLLMHIGCTHREVHKYLPEQAKDLMPGVRNAVSPTKVAKTPAPTQSPAPVQDMFQKFAKNIVRYVKGSIMMGLAKFHLQFSVIYFCKRPYFLGLQFGILF